MYVYAYELSLFNKRVCNFLYLVLITCNRHILKTKMKKKSLQKKGPIHKHELNEVRGRQVNVRNA